MELWSSLLGFLVLLAAAAVLGLAAERLRHSPAVGYMAAGMLLGPGALAVVSGDAVITGAAEMGVVLLLFTVGLEFPWRRLRSMGALALGGGALQLALTSVAGSLAFLSAGFGWKEAVLLGSLVAPSATALLLRLFAERAETDSTHARNASVITVLQGAYDVPLLVLITALGATRTAGHVTLEIAKAIGFAAALFAGLYVLVALILPRLLGAASRSRTRELPVMLATLVCMVSAWAAHALGTSPALGAFVAGCLLAESPFATQVRADVTPLKALLVTAFFASFGIMIDVTWLWGHLPAVVLTVLAVVVGKTLVVWPVMRLFGSTHADAVATGLCLATLDEFVFVLARLGASLGVLSADSFGLLATSALVLLLATPFLVWAAPRAGKAAEAWLLKLRLARRYAPRTMTWRAAAGHVVIVGYGPAGQCVAKAVRGTGSPSVVVELNPGTVAQALAMGVDSHVGDASSAEVLDHLNVTAARAVVVTVPDHRTAACIIRQVRAMAPHIVVIARSRDHVHAADLEAAGAKVVVDEEIQIGYALGMEVVRHLPRPRAGDDRADADARTGPGGCAGASTEKEDGPGAPATGRTPVIPTSSRPRAQQAEGHRPDAPRRALKKGRP